MANQNPPAAESSMLHARASTLDGFFKYLANHVQALFMITLILTIILFSLAMKSLSVSVSRFNGNSPMWYSGNEHAGFAADPYYSSRKNDFSLSGRQHNQFAPTPLDSVKKGGLSDAVLLEQLRNG